MALSNVNPSDLVTSLNQGYVDAIAIWEPWGSTALTKVDGAVRVQQGGCQNCYDPGTLLTTKKVIAEKPEGLQRFMDAFAEAQQWVRENTDEAAEINMRWIQGVDIDTMKLSLGSASLDSRMSKYTVDMYRAKSIPGLIALEKIDGEFDPAPAVDPEFIVNTMKNHPEYFSDLAPIQESLKLN